MSGYDQEVGDKYCIACSGETWFAFPAVVVREVAVRPRVVQVPHSDRVLSGLCHLRNEFLPVLRASVLLGTSDAAGSEERMIVMTGVDGPWGLLVDSVAALEPLEISYVREWESADAWSSSMIGTASYREQIVQVLDPEVLHRFVVSQLKNASTNTGGAAVYAGQHVSAEPVEASLPS